MFSKFLLAYICIGISQVLCTTTTTSTNDSAKEKDTKDKRQIYETNINPNHQQSHQQQEPSSRIDTIYGSHPNQFVIRAIGQPLHHHHHPQQQQQQQLLLQQQQQQHQQQQQQQQLQQQQQQHELQQRQSSVQHPEQTAEVSQQYALVQELQAIPAEKSSKSPRKYHQIGKPAPIQYIQERQSPQHQPQFIQAYQHQQPIQQYHVINPQDELLKFLQDEIAVRALSLQNPKRPQHKPIPQENANAKQGLGNYREPPVRQDNQEVFYIQENVPQQYFPIDYHKSIPNHPLAASSLEKELEKLVASNKPHNQQQIGAPQSAPYKAVPKIQEQAAATFSATATSVPASALAQKDNFLSYFPDFAQLSGFKPTGEIFFDEQIVQEQPKVYPTESIEREQKPRKASSSSIHNQYLIEKTKYKPNQSPFINQKPVQHPNFLHDNRNSAMKIIDAPALNYEKSQPSPSPLISYYKAESTERPENVIPHQHKLPSAQPSTSSIFVSQGTGLHPSPIPPQQVKPYANEKPSKLPQLPPFDGKPLTPEEFQALVDAGYPVQAVPVPVPVPYEAFIKSHQKSHQHIPDDHQQRNQRRQIIRPSQKQPVTYLHPIRLREREQEQERSYTQST